MFGAVGDGIYAINLSKLDFKGGDVSAYQYLYGYKSIQTGF